MAVGELLISRVPEQLGGQRSHPAALCGCEGFLLPGDVAWIVQASAKMRRAGQRPDMRPEMPATGGTAAGDGVGEVTQCGARIADGGAEQAKTVCRPGLPARVGNLACARESLLQQVTCCHQISGGDRDMTEQRERGGRDPGPRS